MRRERPRAIATLGNAYRVANRIAEDTNTDMQVAATGEPERPFIAQPADTRARNVVARIIVR